MLANTLFGRQQGKAQDKQMPYITETRSDVELKNKLPNFKEQAAANATALGLSQSDLDSLDDNVLAFDTGMDNVDARKAAAKSAVSSKNASRSTLKAQIAQFAKTWRANPAIDDSLLAKLDVPPHQTQGSSTPPVTPTSLEYSVNTENVITLKWKRNGNKSGTIFNVQSSSNGTSGWSVAQSTTATKVTMSGTPGVSIWFRVVAIRGGVSAAPTQPIVVWPTSGESFELVAA